MMKILKHIWLVVLVGFCPVVMAQQTIPVKIQPRYQLMAHRGGVVDSGTHPENSLAALDEAVSRGYVGAEIDIRQTRDGVLFLHHNRTFSPDFDTNRRGEEMTWAEIQAMKPLHPKAKLPVTLEEYCRHAQGKLTELMIDIKVNQPTQAFYQEVERILTKYDFLKSSYFIGHGEYFRGRGGCRITMLMREREPFFSQYGERTGTYFFLFAGVDELNAQTIQWCRDNGVEIVACINRPYRPTNIAQHLTEVERNVRWLKEWQVTHYQLDSDYDFFFRY